jgi:AcrR family transcriptional regulator
MSADRTLSDVAVRLKALRERAGISVREMADRLGFSTGGTYQHYEDRYKKDHLPPAMVQKLTAILQGHGHPPITRREIVSLGGGLDGFTSTNQGDDGETAQPNVRTDTSAFERASAIPEIDVRGGMGGGGVPIETVTMDADGNHTSGESVRGTWHLPSAYVQNELRIGTSAARIIEVVGDSMAPTLLAGDRVLIDTADQNPTPPGIFALFDGYGVIVKRLERVARGEPPSIRVISDNPHHGAYELSSDEVRIIGRVVWFGRRL